MVIGWGSLNSQKRQMYGQQNYSLKYGQKLLAFGMYSGFLGNKIFFLWVPIYGFFKDRRKTTKGKESVYNDNGPNGVCILVKESGDFFFYPKDKLGMLKSQ